MSDPTETTSPSGPPSATTETLPPVDPRFGPSEQTQQPQQASESRSATPQVRRTAAIVITSLGALLLTAAATVFMVIAWERLRLPGKVGVVGLCSASALFAGHHLRHRLPGVAAVLTHLGAVLAPLVAGAGAVALGADRPTVAVAGGLVGLFVLQAFDRMRSPVLAAGRALAGAGVAVGLGVWLGVSPALILLALAALTAVADRWDESISTSLLAASTPLIGWGASVAEVGSLLPWLDELSAMDQWVTALVAVGSLTIIAAQILRLPSPRLGVFRGQFAAVIATAIFAINVTDFADTALAHPDAVLLALASSALIGRAIERLWTPSIGLVLDVLVWFVTGLVWFSLLNVEAVVELQRTEAVAAVLLLVSWLLQDLLAPEPSRTSWFARLKNGAAGPISSLGIIATSIAIALAGADPAAATIGLAALGLLFAVSSRCHRSELAMACMAASLVAAVGAPLFLPVVPIATLAAATVVLVSDLRRGAPPRTLQPIQLISLVIASAAIVIEPIVTEPSWWSSSLHLAAITAAALAIGRFSHVPDLLLGPRLAMGLPALGALGEPRTAGILAVIAGVALIIDRELHQVKESRWIGLALTTIGSWLLAADAGVTTSLPYVAIPCLILAAYGYDIIRRSGSSWVAMAPAVGIFSLVGIAERLDGGNGWHAVATGGVAIGALVIGVDRRWAGPSLIGLLSLIGVVGIETSAYVPEVPLWIWLAVGGAALVGAGVHLERSADGEGTATLRSAWESFR